ncbi:YccF domain-containing protein [Arcanobacterium haemolyticum]|uniref:Inner membrane component domain-containing protein n=1 Tax=Arcanobacterium haemolyticum (strain ATCC 9345 / DSM 20595 / CCM 5947 / CCUG 17215 / LMG 16163 / NBRC 15585 / NCTC 8452 / 11018) TaxID=644284 RepID=D7BL23_ARCHD|nr:YccF domain-containing protein [Arcanobacterium haemolyticum]ADH93353.1 protein of unknown function DUF307 [Arcanobacterium haemolyticum DSM 20595]QCX47377.1 YccF domain-containing protein [Arcanobacterium haemolyticum]
MTLLLNLIWLIFGGFFMFLGYLVFGFFSLIFIITIPVGVAILRMANYILWPFGRTVVRKPSAGSGSALMNFLWFIIAGLWLSLGHILSALALAITIIGIPLAIVHLKLIQVSAFPFGKMIVPNSQASGYDVIVRVN